MIEAILAVLSAVSMLQNANQTRAAAETARRQAETRNRMAVERQRRREMERKDLLRRQKAAQRARLSGLGTGAGGSAAAVLAGLERRAAQDIAEDRALFALQREAAHDPGPGGGGSPVLEGLRTALGPAHPGAVNAAVETGGKIHGLL